MKLVDYELILKELREKYPDHTIHIKATERPNPQWWSEPGKTLWIDGKATEISWYGSIAEDIYLGTEGKVDPHNEISFIINEEIKKYLDIL